MTKPESDASDEFLPTRQSLLERLKDLDDQASWDDFFRTYWKLIYSVARRAGLSDAEAQDVVQETIISVSKKIKGFKYDPEYGSFKAWLKRLTQWRIGDFLRKKQYQYHGKRLPKDEPLRTSFAEQQEDPAFAELENAWDEEWEKNLFDLALERVKKQVSPRQYQMFYFHICKEFPARQVAQRLKAKLNEVYMAKYRISSLIEKEIKQLEREIT